MFLDSGTQQVIKLQDHFIAAAGALMVLGSQLRQRVAKGCRHPGNRQCDASSLAPCQQQPQRDDQQQRCTNIEKWRLTVDKHRPANITQPHLR